MVSLKPPFAFETAVGAIRMALEGGKNDETKIALVYEIIENTAKNEPADMFPVEALLWALNSAGGTFEVNS